MKRFLLTVVCSLAALAAAAQTLPSLIVPGDPASAGMACASAALEAGAFSFETNAAAMSQSSETVHAGAAYGLWQPLKGRRDIVSAGGFFRWRKLAVGVGTKILLSPGYETVNSSGVTSQTAGVFKPSEGSFALAAAYDIAGGFAAGATFHVGKSSLGPDARCTFFTADIALRYRLKGLSAGLVASGLGPKVSYGAGSYASPMMVRGGVAYTLVGSVTLDVELDYAFGSKLMAAFGARYSYRDMVYVSAGYHYGAASAPLPSFASAGVGVSFWGVGLGVSCLFASPTLDASTLVGLTYRF